MVLAGNVTRHVAEADLSAIAEIHAGIARRRVERDETGVESGFENSSAAGFAFRHGMNHATR